MTTGKKTSGTAKNTAPAPTKQQKKLFVATQTVLVDENTHHTGRIIKGEVAIEGAKILKTCGHLFKPLAITYQA